MRPLFAFTILLILIFLFAGCAVREKPVEVLVPVKVKVEKPKRPMIDVSKEGLVESYKKVLIYLDQLEYTLKEVTKDD